MGMPKVQISGVLILAAFAVSCVAAPLSEQGELETVQSEAQPAFSPPKGTLVSFDEQVRMRDNVRLNTDIYVPNGGKTPVATVLIRTPYDTELGERHQALLERGYAIVEQHERGRYLSEGEFSMLPRPLEDGWDTLDWIASQSWSDGRVATIGCSSSAENQLKLAAAGHPAHKAFIALSAGVGVAEAGPFKEQGNFWRGGAWQQGWFDYFYKAMHQDWPQLPAGLSDEERQRQLAMMTLQNSGWQKPAELFDDKRMHLPMIEIMDQLEAPRNEVAEYLARGPNHPDWSKNRVVDTDFIAVPGYWAEAIYDISTRSTVAFFEQNRQKNLKNGNDNQSLRLTQGGHCSFGVETDDWKMGDLELGDARFPVEDEIIAWLDAWMPVDPTSESVPAFTGMKAYLADGDWRQVEGLSFGGGAVWSFNSDGEFGPIDHSTEPQGAFTFAYDPADPAPSMGGEIGGTGSDHHDGAFDQTPLEERQDVVVFSSTPLEAPMDVLGYAKVSLTVSSDQPDTDFTVKIMDVYPDGRAYNIGDTILRMRYRDGLEDAVFMTSGVKYDVELPPILLSRRIEAGHSIKVYVSSSDFPNYSRNLNTQLDPYTSTDAAVATNSVYYGENTMSQIEWPAAAPSD